MKPKSSADTDKMKAETLSNFLHEQEVQSVWKRKWVCLSNSHVGSAKENNEEEDQNNE